MIKLGSGAFADVYKTKINNKYVAVKIPNDVLSEKETMKYTNDEVEILSKFANSKYLINMIDYKITDGEKYIVLELMGDNVSTLLDHYSLMNERMPISNIKHITKQILNGLDELKKCNILHNDLKLENLLFTKPLNPIFKISKSKYKKYTTNVVYRSYLALLYNNPYKINVDIDLNELKAHMKNNYNIIRELLINNMNVKITDFGNAYTKHLADRNHKMFIRSRPTRHYISPEILLGIPHWVETDMWAVGCMVFELLTNQLLFDPRRNNNMGINSAHLLCVIQFFGKIPNSLISAGKKSKRYFIENTHYFNYLLIGKYDFRSLLKSLNVPKKEISGIVEFLMPIFELDKHKRITPSQCLKSSWLL